jgi:soluble calcium-activated nucleotidase 1
VQWEDKPDAKIISSHNEAGRGMELSELVTYNGRLYAPDDRTGIAYEIIDPLGKPKAVPRFLCMEGSGNTDKGQKNEWATVKDGTLYIGSYGKEYTDTVDGKYVVTSRTNLWVALIDANGKVTKIDWTHNYAQVRAAGNAAFPGYMVQEAVIWSDVHRKWFVLPRRASSEKYDEEKDENMGTNMVLVADEDFGKVQKINIGEVTDNGRRGFSSAKFVPGTNDEVIVALKSMEHEEKDPNKPYFTEQESYITVFNWKTQQVLMKETRVGGGEQGGKENAYKYEGLEFIF